MVANIEKLVCVIMGQDCEKFIPMCLNSVKDADAIVYYDGDSTDSTCDIVLKEGNKTERGITMIVNPYNQNDLNMNGKQRNFYLEYLKENYKGWFALCLDADEVVENLQQVKDFINTLPEQNHNMLFSPKMRHLIGNLGHEDASRPIHYVPHRLFKVRDDLEYPECEHPVLGTKKGFEIASIPAITIWHMSHIAEAFNVKKKYENHIKKSKMHPKEMLHNWYTLHLFGKFPTSPINLLELPEVILNEFGIDKDELYFGNRKEMEAKHYQDAIDWKHAFNPKEVLCIGCGFGQRVNALRLINVSAWGLELSNYAVKNSLQPLCIFQDDIVHCKHKNEYDLVVAYDICEHLKYEDLDKAINNMIGHSKSLILISIPFKGNPNLENDSTHIIKESRAWWIEQFISKGLTLIDAPKHFLYADQILIFEKGGNDE